MNEDKSCRAPVLAASENLLWIPERTNVGKISIKETYKTDPLTMKTNRRALVLGASKNLLWIPERTNVQKISIKETSTRDLLTV